MSLEDATKSYFLQCLNDPDILREIKKGLVDLEEPYSNSIQGGTQENNSLCSYEESNLLKKENIALLEEKVNSVLEKQSLFEKHLGELLIKEHDRLISILGEKDENRYKEEINKKYIEIQHKLNEAVKENEALHRELDKIKSEFSPFKKHMEMWNELEMLNAEKKDYIGQLCGNYNIDACLSLGRDAGKIEQLWRYLREEILKVDFDNTVSNILNHYFEYCLDIANSLGDNVEHYVFSEIEVGSEFDKELCIRTSDSKQIGCINKVLTKCVKVGDSVLYKAIVKVE